MKTTNLILIITWCLIGAISVWRTYYGMQKDWYKMFQRTMDEDDCRSHKLLLKGTPALMLGGLIIYVLFAISMPQAWYFRAPKK